ncbi:MAG: DUF2092 domain-containing protein [Chthoniobacter sp.]|uniref:DUF2092 domain-containing protein n=1 Tax=Chthoniobacter sp. TaxID=2510640 RepID=UPI0032A207BE
MKPTLSRTIAVLALLAGSSLSATAAEPNADQLLKQMSAKLAAAHSFSFRAEREIDAALLEGRNVPEQAYVAVLVQRPNQLAGRSTSKGGVRHFIFNGQTLSLVDEKKNGII